MRSFLAKLKLRYVWLILLAKANDFLLLHLGDSVAKWVAGVAGVILAIAVSFSSSAYTSFIQVYDKCQARLIASDAILTGRVFALSALAGAFAALFGLALPHLSKQLWYSSRTLEARKSNTPLPTLNDWHPTTLIANIQSALIVLGFRVVAVIPLAALSVFARQTPEGLAQYVRTINATCVKQNAGAAPAPAPVRSAQAVMCRHVCGRA